MSHHDDHVIKVFQGWSRLLYHHCKYINFDQQQIKIPVGISINSVLKLITSKMFIVDKILILKVHVVMIPLQATQSDWLLKFSTNQIF